MAKAYGTVGIASGAGKMSAHMGRQALLVQNLSALYPIYLNFGDEADNGSATIQPNENLFFRKRQYPSIGHQINLVTDYQESTGSITVTKSSTGGISASGTTLTIADAFFLAGEVGEAITVEGAGVDGADLVTTIASYTSTTIVEVSDAASTTVANAPVTWDTGKPAELTLDTADFIAGDVGAEIEVVGAGADGTNLVTTIASFTSTTVVGLTDSATQNVASERVRWGSTFPAFVAIDNT